MKKLEKKKNASSGFTLIELLAVIAILSVVISFGIYVAISVIGKSKEKSYETTIENIENIANDYLIEKSNKLFFVALASNNDLEYQCIQVKNLVDMGYFDNDIVDSLVSEDDTVSLDDYIYVERNISSKAINRTKYLYDEEMVEYANCGIARQISGYIYFYLKPIDWSKEKELLINYVLKNDLNKTNYIYEYEYSYVENGEVKKEKIADNNDSKKLVIKENGDVFAYIYDKDGNEIADASINISKIDRVGPEINISYEGDYYVGNDVNIPFIVTDAGSGVDYNSFTLDDIIVKINNVEIKDGLTFIDNGDGNFNLNIINNNYNGDLDIIINADRIYDKVENGNSLKDFNDILVFDSEPPTCRLSVTTSGVAFDKKDDNEEIYSYGMNKTGEAVYNKTDNLTLSTGTFYGYVKDTAGNEGSCSATLTSTYVSEYTRVRKTCTRSWSHYTYTCRKKKMSYSCCTYTCVRSKYSGCDNNGYDVGTDGRCYAYNQSSCSSLGSNWSVYSSSCDTCYYSCSTGTGSGNYCYLYDQTSCGSWSTYDTYNNYDYYFSSSTTSVSSCSTGSKFTCNYNNLGYYYTSSCTKKYACSTGKKINDNYCYVINE